MFKLLVTSLLLTLATVSCDTGPTSPRGFSLPAGDEAKGKLVFETYQCLACHALAGYDKSAVAKELETPVALGGKVTRIKTYAELVTSIINPSHKFPKGYSPGAIETDGVSKMRNYNDVMTVDQLIDIVAFLQPHYELIAYEPTYYTNYH